MAHGQNQLSIKPVYNIAQGTKDEFYPFEILRDALTFTYSNATIKGITETLDGVTAYQIASDIPTIIQKQDVIGGITYGDNTDLETIFYLKQNTPYEVTQCYVQAAFATNLTAFTDNGVTFDSVEFEVRKYLSTNLSNYEVIVSAKANTGFAQMVGIDAASVFIFKAQFSGESIMPTDKIGLYFKCNNTQVATNTYQSMFLPYYSFTKTNFTKTWYQSGMASHALPSLDAAAPAFKHTIVNYPIDMFGSIIL